VALSGSRQCDLARRAVSRSRPGLPASSLNIPTIPGRPVSAAEGDHTAATLPASAEEPSKQSCCGIRNSHSQREHGAHPGAEWP
jgi:hypothetical protein